MLGDEMANALHIPKTPWVNAVIPMRAVVSSLELVRRASHPNLTRWVTSRGVKYWEELVAMGSKGSPILFPPPERLLGVFPTA